MPRSERKQSRRFDLGARRHSRPSASKAGGPAYSGLDRVVSIDRAAIPADRPTLTLTQNAAFVYTEGGLVASLVQDIRDLKAAVHRIETHIGNGCDPVVLREMPDTEARAELLSAFHAAGDNPLYYDDLSETLRHPIEQVARLCETLIAEGVLGEKLNDER